jgi:excisionase family DNA binding protein
VGHFLLSRGRETGSNLSGTKEPRPQRSGGDAGTLVYTVPEVAEALGLSQQTVYRLARSGDLPMVKVGRQWFMTKLELFAYLDGRRRL